MDARAESPTEGEAPCRTGCLFVRAPAGRACPACERRVRDMVRERLTHTQADDATCKQKLTVPYSLLAYNPAPHRTRVLRVL